MTSIAVVAMSMGCSRSWPTVTAISDPRFASHRETVRSVDILPVDFQFWTYPGSRYQPEAVASGLDSMVSAMAHQELASRDYDVVAIMDWDGNYDAGSLHRQAMTADEIALTTLSLSTYGAAQSKTKDSQILTPHVPVPLGTKTGADSTLYIGGWAYAGDDAQPSNGAKAAKGILIGVLIIGVIAIAILGAKKGGGSVGKVAGGLAKGTARAVSKGVSHGFGRVAGRLVSTAARGVMRAGIVVGRHGPRIAIETLDAFGRAGFDTHVHVQPYRPDYARHPKTPRKGRSAMLIEMTLVDNHSGRTLWHARRRFPAAPYRADHVRKAMARMMRSLPRSTGRMGRPPGLSGAVSQLH